MSFGLYIHIPYCLQKCHYCDFTTFDLNHKISMDQYTKLIMSELQARAKTISHKKISSLYFGGGTPSLLPAEHILAIRTEISRVGFELEKNAEVTIEINPGTIDQEKLDLYLAAGINRFSVGVQTFNDTYLKNCGREHSAQNSRETLQLLKKNNVNLSFDLLFGLPNQTSVDLLSDLKELLSFSPQHVSLYNLTVPAQHKMNAFRASDEQQADMFQLIDETLSATGIFRYELSNFARPGFESKHNQLYWSDCPYWGIGISSHSYLPELGLWGTRFWNPTSYKEYLEQIDAPTPTVTQFYDALPERQIEHLQLHESLTDYCHTQLRMMRGLSSAKLEKKYGRAVFNCFFERASRLLNNGLLEQTAEGFCLSAKALPVANRVFFELTFLSEELPLSTH